MAWTSVSQWGVQDLVSRAGYQAMRDNLAWIANQGAGESAPTEDLFEGRTWVDSSDGRPRLRQLVGGAWQVPQSRQRTYRNLYVTPDSPATMRVLVSQLPFRWELMLYTLPFPKHHFLMAPHGAAGSAGGIHAIADGGFKSDDDGEHDHQLHSATPDSGTDSSGNPLSGYGGAHNHDPDFDDVLAGGGHAHTGTGDSGGTLQLNTGRAIMTANDTPVRKHFHSGTFKFYTGTARDQEGGVFDPHKHNARVKFKDSVAHGHGVEANQLVSFAGSITTIADSSTFWPSMMTVSVDGKDVTGELTERIHGAAAFAVEDLFGGGASGRMATAGSGIVDVTDLVEQRLGWHEVGVKLAKREDGEPNFGGLAVESGVWS